LGEGLLVGLLGLFVEIVAGDVEFLDGALLEDIQESQGQWFIELDEVET
jgi:hypothetical protein